jgi:ADP-ribose pyrophosphatase YjhB (NUDIX family)
MLQAARHTDQPIRDGVTIATVSPVATTAGLLARGPWAPDQVVASWRPDPYRPAQHAIDAADVALNALRERGSPSHDGFAGRLVGFEATAEKLTLELQPIRWALRLLTADAAQSLSVQCIVRDDGGRWLAGRRADWLASWAGRWALGAAGSVEVDENPTDTMGRELGEEWSVQPERLTVEALVRLPSEVVLLVGLAWLAEGAEVRPDDEHDDFAWWPADVARWPQEADAPLRRMGALLAAG